MTAIDAIISWTRDELPDWQSDAARRLLTLDTITDGDRDELLALLKLEYGILPKVAAASEPTPLAPGMISGAPKASSAIVLKALTAIDGINRIPNGSSLPFGHAGLTVIYGENGSGKSGYARVLKRACRARDTRERIIPDIYGAGIPPVPKAALKISIDGAADSLIAWEEGKSSDSVLVNIAVFDSKCARVIVDEKNEATYLPYGTHVFEGLVQLLGALRLRLQTERPTPQLPVWQEIPSGSPTADLLAALNSDTDPSSLDTASSWTDADQVALNGLTKRLGEIEADDVTHQTAIKRSVRDRIARLREYVGARAELLSDSSIDSLLEKRTNLVEAEKAVLLASETDLKSEPLPGAGLAPWRMLYEAARQYSVGHAYPHRDFPAVEPDDLTCRHSSDHWFLENGSFRVGC